MYRLATRQTDRQTYDSVMAKADRTAMILVVV